MISLYTVSNLSNFIFKKSREILKLNIMSLFWKNWVIYHWICLVWVLLLFKFRFNSWNRGPCGLLTYFFIFRHIIGKGRSLSRKKIRRSLRIYWKIYRINLFVEDVECFEWVVKANIVQHLNWLSFGRSRIWYDDLILSLLFFLFPINNFETLTILFLIMPKWL